MSDKNESKSFSIFSPVTKCWEEPMEVAKGKAKEIKDASGKNRFLQVVVSGIEPDRDNERMSKEAVVDMLDQFKSGTVPLFPNHGRDAVTGERAYNWQDMMGVWVDAELSGDHVVATARLNQYHPDAEKLWNFVKAGMPVGFSVGGNIDPNEVSEEEVEEDDKEETESI